MAKLALENVRKIYKNGYEAVHNFSLEIEEGEFLILVGPSGCGKSTLLRMIAGFEDITSGELWMDGEIGNYKEPGERNLAMVFQNYALYPNMSVYDNIAFSLSVRKKDKEEIDRKVHETAKLLGIEQLLDRRPGELSGGQKQRVAIGNAIIRNPRALLMDEPLSNLDAKLRTQMRVELAALQHKMKTTTIYVTHDQTEAMTLGSRIVVMKEGEMQQVDTPANLYDAPANKFVAGFIGTPSMNFFEAQAVREEEGVLLLVGEHRIRLSGEDAARLRAHGADKVWLGIRPEDIAVSAPQEGRQTERRPGWKEGLLADGNYLEVLITDIELLGAEKLLIFLLYGKKYVAKVPAETQVKTGEQRRLYLNMAAAHLFDCATEKRI